MKEILQRPTMKMVHTRFKASGVTPETQVLSLKEDHQVPFPFYCHHDLSRYSLDTGEALGPSLPTQKQDSSLLWDWWSQLPVTYLVQNS